MTGPVFQKPRKYSVDLWGHRTSVTLEPAFWSALGALAKDQGRSVKKTVEHIDELRAAQGNGANLSSCVRVWVLTALQGG